MEPQKAACAATHAYDTATKAAKAASTAFKFAQVTPDGRGIPDDDRTPSLAEEEREEDAALVRLLKQALLTKLIPVCRRLDITHINELTEYDYDELAADMKQHADFTLLPNTWRKLRALVSREAASELRRRRMG